MLRKLRNCLANGVLFMAVVLVLAAQAIEEGRK